MKAAMVTVRVFFSRNDDNENGDVRSDESEESEDWEEKGDGSKKGQQSQQSEENLEEEADDDDIDDVHEEVKGQQVPLRRSTRKKGDASRQDTHACCTNCPVTHKYWCN